MGNKQSGEFSMTDSLKVVPSTDSVSTGVRDTEPLASGLSDVLADTYRLDFKTHAIHWNVEGPLFFSVHHLTEAQYQDLFAAADVLAERIRALGHLAPSRLDDIIKRSRVEDVIEQLAADHEKLAHRLHALIEMSGSRKDPVTEDLATARSAFHEKAAWMLRALSKT